MECKFCQSQKVVKNGVLYGYQRYLCRNCNKNFRPRELKYSREVKLKVMKSYLNGVGIRAIERIFDVSNQLISYWIKKYGKKLEEIKSKEKVEDEIIMQILEADELFTYIKKTKPSKNLDCSK